MKILHDGADFAAFIALAEIDRVDEVAGLYAWLLIPRFERDLEPVFRTLSQSVLDVDLTGNLYQKYTGKAWSNRQTVEANDSALPIIQLFCCWASPPVYIGQSQNLRSRLTKHQDELRAILYAQSTSSEVIQNYDSTSSVESDTQEESATFARRVGCAMRSNGIKSISNMGILIFMGESFVNKSARLNAERWLNRAFSPLYGRN